MELMSKLVIDPPRILLAPMEGVMDSVMRDMLTRIGGYERCVTEFVRVSSTVLPPKVYYRLCPELKQGGRTAAGTPVYVQLLGSDPVLMAANAAVAAKLGAPGIDLNSAALRRRLISLAGAPPYSGRPRPCMKFAQRSETPRQRRFL